MPTFASRISLAYVLVATFWIGLSDRLTGALAASPAQAQAFQSLKGWGFVLTTGALLYFLLSRWEARRRLLASAAEEAHERLRQMAGSIDEVFWLTNLDKSEMLYVSPAYEAVWERPCQELLADPRSWLDSVHPEDRQRVLEAALARQASGGYDEEYRILRGDGSVGWIRDRAFPVRDEHGRVYRVTGVAADVTARKQAEEAREDAMERLHLALVDSGMCVWEWDLESGAILWSEEASQLFGGSVPSDLEELKRRVHPLDFELVLETAARAAGDLQDFICEFRVLREGGRVIWLESRGRLRRKPRQEGSTFIGTLADVTSSREARAVHERQALRMQAIVEFSPDAIITADEQLRILDFNPGAERIYGYDSQQALGLSLLELVPEELRGELTARLARFEPDGPAAENGPGVSQGRRASGESFPQEATIARLRLPGERLYSVTCRDLTEQVRTEERRRGLEEQLSQARKMEAVGVLAGGVAHDFNNLLTIVQGNTSLLAANPALDPGTRSILADVLGAARRAAELTQQLLIFSRKQVMQPRPLDLSAMVSELARNLEAMLSKAIGLELDLGEVPLVKADRGLIEQLVLNLALNARDAMPRGGSLRLRTRDVTLVEEPHAGRWLELSVQDSGTGIPAEHLPRIFEPFFTTKEVGKGTGLGLATAYSIVEQHQGFILVDSTVGVGSTFRIHLPPLAASRAEPSTAAPPTLDGNEVVLVVEDDPGVRQLIARILVHAGRKVLTAESGPHALEVWKDHKHHVQLLLTDMIMPGSMTGRELALRLRAEKGELRVLYTSGYSREELRSLAPEELEGSFLPKPYLPDQLVAAVGRCLR